jgi:mono/diheme cytochrome c family protein
MRTPSTLPHPSAVTAAAAAAVAGFALAIGIGASPAGPATAADTAGLQPPALLSQTGLYREITTGDIDPRNLPFSPQYPLWSDGAKKSRWIQLPPGTTIDATHADLWTFPVGTRLWKEFAFDDRKVETRMLWHATATQWVFAAYLWNAEQTDAVLAPQDGLPAVHEIEPGKWHSIPGVGDCQACHQSGRSVVLGFNALQLSTDRDPLAPHADPPSAAMTTLATLMDRGLLQPPREDLLLQPPRIRSQNPRTRAVLGYLAANCGGCHNPDGPLADVGLHLQYELQADDLAQPPGLQSAVGQASIYTVPGAPEGASQRLHPGAPQWSAILHRMRSRRPSSQMPPLGTVLVDAVAVELLRQWIELDLPQLAAAAPAESSEQRTTELAHATGVR